VVKKVFFFTTPDNSPPGSRRKAPVGATSKTKSAGNPAVGVTHDVLRGTRRKDAAQ